MEPALVPRSATTATIVSSAGSTANPARSAVTDSASRSSRAATARTSICSLIQPTAGHAATSARTGKRAVAGCASQADLVRAAARQVPPAALLRRGPRWAVLVFAFLMITLVASRVMSVSPVLSAAPLSTIRVGPTPVPIAAMRPILTQRSVTRLGDARMVSRTSPLVCERGRVNTIDRSAGVIVGVVRPAGSGNASWFLIWATSGVTAG